MFITIPAFLPASVKTTLLFHLIVFYRDTTRDHVIWVSIFGKCSPEMPRGLLCLPGSRQPLSQLCTFSPDATYVEVLNTGKEVLLCFLNAPSFCAVSGFKVPLYLFQEAQLRGFGDRQNCAESPEVAYFIADGSWTLACPHRLHCMLTLGRFILA